MEINFGLSVKNSVEAVKLYQEAFGLELGYHMKNSDGGYFHSELSKDGVGFAVVEAEGEVSVGNVVQLGITLESENEVQRAYELLSKDGIIIESLAPLPWSPLAGVVIDRFGVSWYITAPQHRPPDDYDQNIPWESSMYKKPE